MIRSIGFLFLMFSTLVLIQPAWSAYLGNPARSRESSQATLELIYDIGSRDIELDSAMGGTSDLDSRAFRIQYRHTVAPALQVFGRVMPGTGRLTLKNSPFNPVLWGFGVGLQLAPPEPMGVVHVGLVGAWDWTMGQESVAGQSSDDKIGWAEGSAALGASYSPIETVNLYGGISLVKSFLDFELASVETDWNSDKIFGGFLGVEFLPDDPWVLSADFRFGNENMLGLNVGYSW